MRIREVWREKDSEQLRGNRLGARGVRGEGSIGALPGDGAGSETGRDGAQLIW
jgi:hypothetical protein